MIKRNETNSKEPAQREREKEREREREQKKIVECVWETLSGDRTVVLSRGGRLANLFEKVCHHRSFSPLKNTNKRKWQKYSALSRCKRTDSQDRRRPPVLIHDAWLVRGKNSRWPVPSSKQEKNCASREECFLSFFLSFFFLVEEEKEKPIGLINFVSELKIMKICRIQLKRCSHSDSPIFKRFMG